MPVCLGGGLPGTPDAVDADGGGPDCSVTVCAGGWAAGGGLASCRGGGDDALISLLLGCGDDSRLGGGRDGGIASVPLPALGGGGSRSNDGGEKDESGASEGGIADGGTVRSTVGCGLGSGVASMLPTRMAPGSIEGGGHPGSSPHGGYCHSCTKFQQMK